MKHAQPERRVPEQREFHLPYNIAELMSSYRA